MNNLKNKDHSCFKEFIVIGFGASGIASAIELSKINTSFMVIEKRNKFGGCWNDALITSCLQTHRDCYKFANIDYDLNVGSFPNKTEILQYFDKAIKQYCLNDKVIYNVNPKIEKNTLNRCKWKITLDKFREVKTIYCNHILLCLGTNTIPLIPKIEEVLWNLRQKNCVSNLKTVHSSKLNSFITANPSFFKRKRKIAIVGNGASCCDILKNLDLNYNEINHEILVFYKSNKYYLPKHIGGIPCHFFLSKPLLSFFEKISIRCSFILLTIANMLFIHNYLDIPVNKINSFNIIASLIIQEMITKGIVSYHRENITKIIRDKKIIKTDEAIYTDIDIVIFATGYKHTDFLTEVGINFKSDFLYNYVLPLSVYDINNTKKIKELETNVGIIGINRTYNFLINAQVRAKWYIETVFKNSNINNLEVVNWVDHVLTKKSFNNLKFLDSTYELFDIVY